MGGSSGAAPAMWRLELDGERLPTMIYDLVDSCALVLWQRYGGLAERSSHLVSYRSGPIMRSGQGRTTSVGLGSDTRAASRASAS